jgi:hypothetical protein
MRSTRFILTVSALALFGAAQASAQEATPLFPGRTVSGELTADDRRIEGDDTGSFVYDSYAIEARAGQRLEVVMRSSTFDAFVEVYAGADTGQPIASDDDGLGEGTDARVRFSTVDGTYVVRARTLSGLDGGAYTIEVTDRGPAPRAPRPAAIRPGSKVNGEIGPRDPVEEGDPASAYTYDAWSFRARAGDRFAISLESDDFDPVVRVGRMSRDGGFEELARNDDSGAGGLNSYLVFAAPAAGEYVIRAAPLDGTAEGAYSLALAAGPPPLTGRSIALGDTVEGELDSADGINQSGQRAEAWSFSATAGQRIVATARSEAFDTYIDLLSDADGALSSLASDDDGAGEGTDSRLRYTIPADGRYTLEVRAFSGNGEGPYTLTLEQTTPEPAPADLTFGTTLQGEIVEAAPRDGENRAFDAYRLNGEAGNRIQAIMRSGDFDTYLQIGAGGSEFSPLASDDDGLGEGTDSRLNFTLPSSGEFILRASPLYADAFGLYSLELIDKGPQPAPGSMLVGATARGTLDDNDAIAGDGAFYDAYRISVKSGEKLRLTMVSNEFDAFIEIGREDEGGEFTAIVSDDDSLSDTHARLDWVVEEDGEYLVRARSFSQGQTGTYALVIDPAD